MATNEKQIDKEPLTSRISAEQRWARLHGELLPRLISRLEGRFKSRFAVSADSRVNSAVRNYLDLEQKGELYIESDDELVRWLFVAAWRRIKDAIKKEHQDRRQPFEVAANNFDNTIINAVEELSPEFEQFVESLKQEQKCWLDARLQGMESQKIQEELGWTETELDRIRKAVQRKAKRLREAYLGDT